MKSLWEYLVVEEPNPQALLRRLVEAGTEGWEAVGVTCRDQTYLVVLLKRMAS